MVLIFCDPSISVKEAKEIGKKKYDELKQILMTIDTSVMSTDIDGDDQTTLTKLNNIQNLLEEVKEELKKVGDVIGLDTNGLNKRLMTILKLFDSLDPEIGFKIPLIFIENQIILAHSRVSWIVDAQGIIEDSEKAEHGLDFTFDRQRKRLATEFQARFPKFAGYRITANMRGSEIDFKLIDGPPEIEPASGGIPPQDTLEQELDEFMRWELRKSPVDMEFKIFVSGHVIICQVEPVDYGFIYT